MDCEWLTVRLVALCHVLSRYNVVRI